MNGLEAEWEQDFISAIHGDFELMAMIKDRYCGRSRDRLPVYHLSHVGRLKSLLRLSLRPFLKLCGEDLAFELARRYFADHPPQSICMLQSLAVFPEWLMAQNKDPERAIIADVFELSCLSWELLQGPDPVIVDQNTLVSNHVLAFQKPLRFLMPRADYDLYAAWLAASSDDMPVACPLAQYFDTLSQQGVLIIKVSADELRSLPMDPSLVTLLEAMAQGRSLAEALDVCEAVQSWPESECFRQLLEDLL